MRESEPGAPRKFGTAITYGTYDVFHIGHLRLFERLREISDRLVVAVSTDEFNEEKGKRALVPFGERALIVASLRCVDEVIPENSWDQKVDDIKTLGIDVFGMGDDWVGKFDHLKPFCAVVYLPRTPVVSSSELRKLIRLDENGNPRAL